MLVLGLAGISAAQTPAPTKVGIFNAGLAVQSTEEGKKAAEAMNARFAPRNAQFEKRKAEIQSLQDQLTKGRTTLAAEKQAQLTKEIEDATKRLNRDAQDFEDEVNQEQNKIMGEMGGKMMEIIAKYGTDNGYAVIIDVSNPQSGVLWASSGVEITNDIVKLYNAKYPAAASTTAAPAAGTPAGAAKPATPPPAARPPAAPPAKK